jgi:hypothetical protein
MIFKIEIDKYGLTFPIQQRVVLSLFVSQSTRFIHVSEQSTVKLRNFV